jgi:hypothetical protein
LEAGEAVSLTPGIAEAPDGQLTIPAEAFIRLLAGRLDPDHTPAVTATGVGLDRLRRMFPGF